MSPGFEAGGDDGIHAGLLKCHTLFGCGRRANRDDVFRPALFQDFLWWDPADEAEHGYLLVQQDASLILKSGLYSGRGAPKAAIWAASGARLLLNAFSLDVRAPSSSIDTHKFIANGFDVRERISPMTSLIASGAKPCAPNDPSPPKLETAAVNFCDDNPPSGP